MENYYSYVLESLKDQKFYYGSTNDIERRLDQHNAGLVESTRYRRPLKLIGHFNYHCREEALRQEKYLKKCKNKKYVLKLLDSYGVIV